MPSPYPPYDPSQYPDSGVNFSQMLGDAAGGAGAGLAVGSAIPGIGTLVGGLVGGGVGALGGLISGLTGPNPGDIYDNLMQQFYSSPEKQAEDAALTQLQGQTTQGPTATEKANLLTALDTANKQFAGSYGAIQQGAQARGGVGTSEQAALTASQGQGQATQMSSMATSAAAAEEQRRQQAIQAYTQATQQAAAMQDQYRQWASGEAYNRSTAAQAATNTNVMQGLQAIASGAATAAKYNSGQPTPTDPNALAGSTGYTPQAGQAALNFISNSPGDPRGISPFAMGGFQPPPTPQGPPMIAPEFSDSGSGGLGVGGGFFGIGGAPTQNRLPYQPAPGKSVFDLSDPSNTPRVQYPQY